MVGREAAAVSEFSFKGQGKVTFIPYVPGETPTVGDLLGEEESTVGDLTYYVEPEPEFLTSPGVTSAWFLLDGECLPVAIMSAGDGTAHVMRTDL